MKNTRSFLQIRPCVFNVFVSFLIIISTNIYSQNLSGNLKNHTNQKVFLIGFNGFETIQIAKDSIDAFGNFNLKYKDYKGMGYIESSDESKLFVVINEPNIMISGKHLKIPDSIIFENSVENNIFNQYAIEHNQREKALAGWKYLLPHYKNVELLKHQSKNVRLIEIEIDRLEKQDLNFLKNINSSHYVSWFLPLRKLLDDIPISAQ